MTNLIVLDEWLITGGHTWIAVEQPRTSQFCARSRLTEESRLLLKFYRLFMPWCRRLALIEYHFADADADHYNLEFTRRDSRK